MIASSQVVKCEQPTKPLDWFGPYVKKADLVRFVPRFAPRHYGVATLVEEVENPEPVVWYNVEFGRPSNGEPIFFLLKPGS